MGRQLPILTCGPYRQYPVRRSLEGTFEDEHGVCAQCLTGSCCSTEDPIALTSFDVLRLAMVLDMSPVAFLLGFTQDRFASDSTEERHHGWIDNPGSSIVTFLRRRSEIPTSPCIFLKYIVETDGTPRRVCSVHPARPLACREYYYDTCKKRVTGELAAAQAEGFEMIRDGVLTAANVEANWRKLNSPSSDDTLSTAWQQAFWCEMRRATDVDAANEEGAAGFSIGAHQDPIDEKVNRLLSKRNVRFEEKYGPVAHAEQLDDFNTGIAFSGSPDHQRLLRIIRTPPSRGLFAKQDYPYYVGLRTLLPGVRLDDAGESPARTGASDAARVTRGWRVLVALAAHAARTGNLLELEPEGTFELALLVALTPFPIALQRALTGGECLEPTRRWAAGVVARTLGARYRRLRRRRAGHRSWLRLYASIAPLDGTRLPLSLHATVRGVKRQATNGLRSAVQRPAIRPSSSLPESHAWRTSVAHLLDLRASDGLVRERSTQSIEALESLDLERWFASEPGWTFDVLDAFVRHGVRLSAPVRRRMAALAARWATAVELRSAWTDELMLRWPALCATLEISPSSAPGWASSLAHVRAAQAADGSWGTSLSSAKADSIGGQGEYLLGVLHTTTAAIEALCAVENLLGRRQGS